MAPTLKGIKNAFGKFADKFRRRTKKPENSNNLIKYSNANEQVKNKRRIAQYVGLTGKLHGCEHDLSVAVVENEKQQTEINELKRTITNYERIAARDNKINQELQDELVQCRGSKLRKLGSSGRQNTGPTSTVLQTDSPTIPVGLRSVKSGSRRPSKLISPNPELKTIPELNEPTESSSKRRVRLANQNKMVQTALNFSQIYKLL